MAEVPDVDMAWSLHERLTQQDLETQFSKKRYRSESEDIPRLPSVDMVDADFLESALDQASTPPCQYSGSNLDQLIMDVFPFDVTSSFPMPWDDPEVPLLSAKKEDPGAGPAFLPAETDMDVKTDLPTSTVTSLVPTTTSLPTITTPSKTSHISPNTCNLKHTMEGSKLDKDVHTYRTRSKSGIHKVKELPDMETDFQDDNNPESMEPKTNNTLENLSGNHDTPISSPTEILGKTGCKLEYHTGSDSEDTDHHTRRKNQGEKKHRGCYRCGTCGYYPKKEKHDCDEELSRQRRHHRPRTGFTSNKENKSYYGYRNNTKERVQT